MALKYPEISVIIPCYNQGEFLPDAVESIVNQTFENWECIIVNDGSSDNTSDVAKQLIDKHKDKNIKLLEKENEGLSVARNFGIANSCGKYILPFDSDDKLHPEMLEKTFILLENNNNISIAYTDRADFGEASGIVKAGEYNFEKLKYHNHLSYCSLYRKEVWEKVGGYRTMLTMEDWDFWIAAGSLGYYGKRLPLPLFLYRVRNKSLFHGNAHRYWEKLFSQIVVNNSSVYPPALVEYSRMLLDFHNNPQPLVNVIIFVDKNSITELETTVSNVLFQSYENFKVVIFAEDEKTAQKSKKTIGKLSRDNYAKIKGVWEKESNMSDIYEAEYLCYLNSGDLIFPNHILLLGFALENNKKYLTAFSNCASKQLTNNYFKTLQSNSLIPCIMQNSSVLSGLKNLTYNDFIKTVTNSFEKFRAIHVNHTTYKDIDKTCDSENKIKNSEIEQTIKTVEKAIKNSDFKMAENLLLKLLELFPDNNEILYNLTLVKNLQKI
jgi:glycosyltransferase involved in cell wall biosynthesis